FNFSLIAWSILALPVYLLNNEFRIIPSSSRTLVEKEKLVVSFPPAISSLYSCISPERNNSSCQSVKETCASGLSNSGVRGSKSVLPLAARCALALTLDSLITLAYSDAFSTSACLQAC